MYVCVHLKAGMVYALAAQLNKINNDLLWYALVGLTDQYVHQRISTSRYQMDAANFKIEVMNRNVQNDEHAEIVAMDDYPFMLYRHWTLYDSMYHSRAVAIPLGIWKVSGQQRLQVLLAKMGLPLDQARQPFVAMETRYKTLLSEKLPLYASEFRLKDLHFLSFQRVRLVFLFVLFVSISFNNGVTRLATCRLISFTSPYNLLFVCWDVIVFAEVWLRSRSFCSRCSLCCNSITREPQH
jgi:hypothetical protein